MQKIKFYTILWLAKITNWFINIFSLGSGYTWPGHIALKIYPDLLKTSQIRFPKGIVIISGTNGKTTTSKILTHLLESAELSVTNNRTGANLLNGLVSAILLDMDLFGRLSSDVGVFEVDEFTLPTVLAHFPPTVLVLLNLSRDQLDRYGEIDIIFERWLSSIQSLDKDTTVLVDIEQDRFKEIPRVFSGKIYYFNDAAENMSKTNLRGSFNAKNVNAAVKVVTLFDVTSAEIDVGLRAFSAAYGRGELIDYKDKLLHILLSKNPASFNSNLEVINGGLIEADSLLFILNDNIPDGRDVSWIYDIDPKKLEKACEEKQIFVAGTRFLDMCMRLNYAGVAINRENINSSIRRVLNIMIFDAGVGEIIVLPNYSAMLEFRKIVLGRSIL